MSIEHNYSYRDYGDEFINSLGQLTQALTTKLGINPYHTGIAYTDTQVAFGLPNEESIFYIDKERLATQFGVSFCLTEQERQKAGITDDMKTELVKDTREFYYLMGALGYKVDPASEKAQAMGVQKLSPSDIERNTLKAFRTSISANSNPAFLKEEGVREYDVEVARALWRKREALDKEFSGDSKLNVYCLDIHG